MAEASPVRDGYVAGSRGRTWYRIVGDGAAIPLVTIHGGPGATHDHLESLAALADERPVVFYDQLGAGKSDKPDDVSDWNNDLIVDELGRLLDALALARARVRQPLGDDHCCQICAPATRSGCQSRPGEPVPQYPALRRRGCRPARPTAGRGASDARSPRGGRHHRCP
jgi:hypothetical protein